MRKGSCTRLLTEPVTHSDGRFLDPLACDVAESRIGTEVPKVLQRVTLCLQRILAGDLAEIGCTQVAVTRRTVSPGGRCRGTLRPRLGKADGEVIPLINQLSPSGSSGRLEQIEKCNLGDEWRRATDAAASPEFCDSSALIGGIPPRASPFPQGAAVRHALLPLSLAHLCDLILGRSGG